MWYGAVNWFIKITAFIPQRLCFRTRTFYEDKGVQGRRIKGSAIIVSNHTSVYDFVSHMFTFGSRTLRCVVAEVLYTRNALFTWFLKILGCIRVDRSNHDFAFIRKSCDILEKGGVVEIYPESRLPLKGEKTPLPFKPGTAYLALLSGAPVIPVYTDGNYFNRKRNLVIIGKPIDVRALYDESLSEQENLEAISDTLREKIIQLKHELERQSEEERK